MTNQQLHRLCEERAPCLEPFIRGTISNEDLVQEARMGAYMALKRKPKGTIAYLLNGAKWQMIDAAKRGKSIAPRRSLRLTHLCLYDLTREMHSYLLR